MARAARIRAAVLGLGLAGTVAAMVYPVDEPAREEPPRVTTLRSTVPLISMPASHAAARVAQHLWEPLSDDPFAPRGWSPSGQQAATTPFAAIDAEAPAAQPGASSPPGLPFQFVGRMTDSTQEVVYLTRGDHALLARTGVVLEDTYKVLEITRGQISFEYLPTGQKQILAIPSEDH